MLFAELSETYKRPVLRRCEGVLFFLSVSAVSAAITSVRDRDGERIDLTLQRVRRPRVCTRTTGTPAARAIKPYLAGSLAC